MNFQVSKEITDNFVPKLYDCINGRECLKWNKFVTDKKGRRKEYYVEVRNPAFKIEKEPTSQVQIISNIKNITATNEYNLDTLKFLLNALNRS